MTIILIDVCDGDNNYFVLLQNVFVKSSFHNDIGPLKTVTCPTRPPITYIIKDS